MPWWRQDGEEIGHVTRVLVKHTIYLVLAILCMRFIEWVIEVIFGKEKAFGLFPIGWPFLAGDLVMACAFYYFAFRELKHVLGREPDDT
jgi:hypothetical protein